MATINNTTNDRPSVVPDDARVPRKLYEETRDSYRERLAGIFAVTRLLVIRNKIVDMTTGLVWKVVKQNVSGSNDLHDDVWSFAVLKGLIPAVDDFSPEKAVPFRQYAVRKVKWAILEYFRTMQADLIVIPRGTSTLIREGVSKTDGDCWLDELTDVQYSKVISGLQCKNVASLDQLLENSDGNPHSTEPYTEDKCFSVLELAQSKDALGKLLRRVPDLEAHVIRLHYYEGYTLAEIACNLELSLADVTKLHCAAIRYLKRNKALLEPD